MRLPEIRDELHLLATNADIRGMSIDPKHLHYLADQITRRPSLSRAKATSQKMTPALKKRIRRFHLWKIQNDPSWSQHKTAVRFNVNPGRVSEAINGKRQ